MAKTQNKNVEILVIDSPAEELFFELDMISDCYYNYLLKGYKPLGTMLEKLPETDKIANLNDELNIVKGYFMGNLTKDKLLVLDFGNRNPMMGCRRLPHLNTGKDIFKVYKKHIMLKADQQLWKHNDYDLYMEISIAQCKALLRYQDFIEAQIKEINSSRDEIKNFHWDENKYDLLSLLYKIGKNKLFECTQEEFEIAFGRGQGKAPAIKWLIKPRKGPVSKVSLFYFLRELMDRNYILTITLRLSDTIRRIFRDSNGNKLNNMNQSKNSPFKGVEREIIDKIIGMLDKADADR